MAISTSRGSRGRLLASTLLAGMAATTLGGAAFAQTATPAPPCPASQPDCKPTATAPAEASNQVTEVVVTGSLLRHKLSDSDAPITTLSSEDLDKRGITTIQDAVQKLSANGSGNLPASFSANGAFAAGAVGASLRGLTTNSTLTLVDGLRVAYYPLADDGVRNFVDLNSIPDIITDNVQVLKDGASSVYGADAIAGVINVITKRTYEGLTVRGEGGFSQAGGGDTGNFQALIGHGNLANDGYNVYLGLEYQHDSKLYNRDRGFPYNTADLSSLCTPDKSDCRPNSIANGLQFDGSYAGISPTTVPVVRPRNAANTGYAGDYQLLNPAAGCRGLTPTTITPDAAAINGITGFSNPVNLCQEDFTKELGEISPDDKRFSASFRATKNFGATTQAYFTANYYQNDVNFTDSVFANIRSTTPPGNFPSYSSTSIALPVYVCAGGQNCSAANGTLNPNNPFAALGEQARIYYRFGDIPTTIEDFSQSYRITAGIKGDLPWGFKYSVDGTGSQTDLTVTAKGQLYVSHLLAAVADGSYNFVDPSLNTQAVRDFVSPTNIQHSVSKLYQIQGNISRDLFELPGGPLQFGLSAAARYEAINNPSANPDYAGQPTERYFRINGFGTIGDRDTESVSFEFIAPVIKQLEVNFSGRYDTYSTGQDNFSPKFGAKFKPIRQITFRGTYSEGFRIPSFAESNSLPTTGYITTSVPGAYNAAFNAAHGGDGYGNNYSLGETSTANPNLQPEKSQNVTGGVVFEPIRQLSFSIDYFRIKKTDVIAPQNCAAAIGDYYAGTPLPAGCTAVPDVVDPNFPNAQPRLGFLISPFANLNEQTVSGYDFGATARFNLPFGIKYSSSLDATYIIRFNTVFPDGTTQHYAGTIGPYNTTSASGTPKFRGNWSNTFSYGPAALTLTAYYTDGYDTESEDQGEIAGNCASSAINAVYYNGSQYCHVASFTDVDAHVTYDITKQVQLYMDISNLFDRAAPYDPVTYGGYNYNPAWANAGIYGRYFKFGAKATF